MTTVRTLEENKARKMAEMLCDVLLKKTATMDKTDQLFDKVKSFWMLEDSEGQRVHSMRQEGLVSVTFERLLMEDTQEVWGWFVGVKGLLAADFVLPAVEEEDELERGRQKVVTIGKMWNDRCKYLSGSYAFFERVYKAPNPEEVDPMECSQLAGALLNWTTNRCSRNPHAWRPEITAHLENRHLWDRAFLEDKDHAGLVPIIAEEVCHLDPSVYTLADMIELVYQFARLTFNLPFAPDMFRNMTRKHELAIYDTSGAQKRYGVVNPKAKPTKDLVQHRIVSQFFLDGQRGPAIEEYLHGHWSLYPERGVESFEDLSNLQCSTGLIHGEDQLTSRTRGARCKPWEAVDAEFTEPPRMEFQEQYFCGSTFQPFQQPQPARTATHEVRVAPAVTQTAIPAVGRKPVPPATAAVTRGSASKAVSAKVVHELFPTQPAVKAVLKAGHGKETKAVKGVRQTGACEGEGEEEEEVIQVAGRKAVHRKETEAEKQARQAKEYDGEDEEEADRVFRAREEDDRRDMMTGQQGQDDFSGASASSQRLDMNDGLTAEEARMRVLKKALREQECKEMEAQIAASVARTKKCNEEVSGAAQKKQKVTNGASKQRAFLEYDQNSGAESDEGEERGGGVAPISVTTAATTTLPDIQPKPMSRLQSQMNATVARASGLNLFAQARAVERANDAANDVASAAILSAFSSAVRAVETPSLAGVVAALTILFDGRPHATATPRGSWAERFEAGYEVIYRQPVEHEIVVMVSDVGARTADANRPANPYVLLEGCEHAWFRTVATTKTGVTLRHCQNIWPRSENGSFSWPWNKKDECRVLMDAETACFLSPRGSVLAEYNKTRPNDHPFPVLPAGGSGRHGGVVARQEEPRAPPRFGGAPSAGTSSSALPASPGMYRDLAPFSPSASPSGVLSSQQARVCGGAGYESYADGANGYYVRPAASRYTQRDRHGHQLLSSASKEDDQILDHSLALRAFLAQAGMIELQDSAPELTPVHLTLEVVIPRRLSNWFRFNVVGVDCPALELAFYAQGDEALKRRALYLRFQTQEVQDASSLRLEHFLVWPEGKPRRIVSLEDVQEALRGLNLWLVFLLGQLWRGVMTGILEDITSHRFKGYPVTYLLRWIYEAMNNISKIGRDEPTWHEEPQQEMRDRAAQAFTDIKLHADVVKIIEYSLASGQGSFHFGAVPLSPGTPGAARLVATAPNGTPIAPTLGGSSSNSSGSSSTITPAPAGFGVCFGALGEKYGNVGSKCRHGALCSRLHYEQLPKGTTRGSLTAMLGALGEGPLRTAILEGIAKDPNLAV